MGQQQLLLLSVGVITVGIAIVLSVDLFTKNSFEANKDAVAADIMNIGASAQQFYKTPSNIGGGDNTFSGFSIPAQLAATANGSYSAVVSPQAITITGIGVVPDASGKNYSATGSVTPHSITISNSEDINKQGDEEDDNKDDDKKKDKDKEKDKDKDDKEKDKDKDRG